MARFHAIVMKGKDNVCTVVEPIVAGMVVTMEVEGNFLEVPAVDSIPIGHKMAIREIACGDIIIKYGEAIGRATKDIKTGRHVHVHNLESCRGRGDRLGAQQE